MKKLIILLVMLYMLCNITMATEITATTVVGPYPRGVQADALDVSFIAATVGNSTFVCTGSDLLIASYGGATSATMSLISATDEYGRTGHISDYSIASGTYSAFWFGAMAGWADSNNRVTVQSATSTLQLAILRIPYAFRGIPAATTVGIYSPKTVLGPYPGTVSAQELDFSMAAGVVAAATFPLTNKEVLLLRNTDSGAHTVTITSVADKYQRTGDITAYSIGANEWAAFFFGDKYGWADSNGCASITLDSALVKVAVLRIPQY